MRIEHLTARDAVCEHVRNQRHSNSVLLVECRNFGTEDWKTLTTGLATLQLLPPEPMLTAGYLIIDIPWHLKMDIRKLCERINTIRITIFNEDGVATYDNYDNMPENSI